MVAAVDGVGADEPAAVINMLSFVAMRMDAYMTCEANIANGVCCCDSTALAFQSVACMHHTFSDAARLQDHCPAKWYWHHCALW